MDFEKASSDLEEIIKKLESGSVGLQEGLKLYEEGAEIIKAANKELGEAKGKITVIKNQIETPME